MIRFSSINRLIMTPVLAIITVLVLLNAASLTIAFSLINNIAIVEQTNVVQERQINEALNEFKTQVQEWKNVLLRGRNEEDRLKYWQRFKQREESVQQQLDSMLQNSQLSGPVSELIERFLSAHHKMGVKYRDGYAAFVSAGFDPTVGDSYVRGIDREPAKLLQQTADNIAANTRTAKQQVSTNTSRLLWLILSSSVLLSVLCIVYLVFNLRRNIVKPTREIAQCLKSMEQKAYDYQLTYHSEHELGLVASATRHLQSKLQDTVGLLSEA
ncbi:hypothetical protein [Alteromonas gilva]|uniref:HAMP domain-containing protein n=1 Tax=Alteromonas gilva TaxID=2987522 RepID=A0ABT5L6P6_9ALTE|nr:hypothetical protein [Alteromonas gilva]MDC8832709.1 hypothetical protein [Alteromonas gilva]